MYIPPAWEIEEQLALTDDGQWQWAVFPGNWGAPLSASPLDLYCFGDNDTTIVACPSNSTTIKWVAFCFARIAEIYVLLYDQC